jgi:hypothetical protein
MAGAGDKGLPNGLPVDEWGIRVEGCSPVGSSVERGGATNGPAAVYATTKYVDWLRKYAPPEAQGMTFSEAGPVPAQGGVALHPLPLQLMVRQSGIELAPKVFVFHGLLRSRFPAALFPLMDPLRDAVLHVLGVDLDPDAARLFDRFQPLDHSRHFHAVVRGLRMRTPDLSLVSAEA